MGAAISAASAFATGTVSSEVKDNVAYVYHKDAHWNCCPDTVMEVIPNADTANIIDIYERDLCINPCGCECYFDFTHTLDGLAPGTYNARVWEVFCEDEPLLTGTTDFVIPAQTGLSDFSSIMSKCHDEPHGIGEDTPLPLAASIETSSPIAARSAEITYTLEQASDVFLAIYNSAGIKICSLRKGAQIAGMHTANWNTCDDSGKRVPRGTYFAILETRDGVCSLPLIVLR